MVTTTSKPGERSHLQRTARSRKAGYARGSRDRKFLTEIRPRSIAYHLDGAIEEGSKAASPRVEATTATRQIDQWI